MASSTLPPTLGQAPKVHVGEKQLGQVVGGRMRPGPGTFEVGAGLGFTCFLVSWLLQT